MNFNEAAVFSNKYIANRKEIFMSGSCPSIYIHTASDYEFN